mmetsp:Transcript_7720/g.47866  ORF Transcript_7720/g.47866 Transcript_7720/m.47866 type:complete len:219 (+) Transcript_7720:1625-2281(+)
MGAQELRQHVHECDLFGAVVHAKEMDVGEHLLHVPLAHQTEEICILCARGDLLQVFQARVGDLFGTFGHEAPFRVDVHGLSCQSSEFLWDLHVHGQLHAQLRLSDPRNAAELRDLARRHATAQQLIQGWTERHHSSPSSLLLENHVGGLATPPHRRTQARGRAAAVLQRFQRFVLADAGLTCHRGWRGAHQIREGGVSRVHEGLADVRRQRKRRDVPT